MRHITVLDLASNQIRYSSGSLYNGPIARKKPMNKFTNFFDNEMRKRHAVTKSDVRMFFAKLNEYAECHNNPICGYYYARELVQLLFDNMPINRNGVHKSIVEELSQPFRDDKPTGEVLPGDIIKSALCCNLELFYHAKKYRLTREHGKLSEYYAYQDQPMYEYSAIIRGNILLRGIPDLVTNDYVIEHKVRHNLGNMGLNPPTRDINQIQLYMFLTGLRKGTLIEVFATGTIERNIDYDQGIVDKLIASI
jgi:hypothetical protein